MQLKVKTQNDTTYTVSVNPSFRIRDLKNEVHRLDPQLEPNKHRILFQGRFYDDESSLDEIGLQDGHTTLLVPKPAGSRRQERRSSSSTIRQSESMQRIPPEVLRFLEAQQRIFALIQSRRRDPGVTTDDEMDAMESQRVLESVSEVRECDGSDLLLGFAFGFLLGPIAGLCLIENALSRHLRAGMLIGIICEVVVALFKMATNIPKGV